jgi:hypothetical protein
MVGTPQPKITSKLPPTSKAWQFVIVFQLPTTIDNPLAFHPEKAKFVHHPLYRRFKGKY